MIGYSLNSLNQSDAKYNPVTTWSAKCFQAFSVHVIFFLLRAFRTVTHDLTTNCVKHNVHTVRASIKMACYKLRNGEITGNRLKDIKLLNRKLGREE